MLTGHPRPAAHAFRAKAGSAASTACARGKKALPLVVGSGLLALTLAVFLQTAAFNFVNYDDHTWIVKNPHLQSGVNPGSILWAVTTGYAGSWTPVAWLSHLLDVELFGLNPAGHHLTSVFFHCLNVVLLFVLLRTMTGALWKSAFAAALFAVHPLHVESVAWVSERRDVLSAFFMILTLFAYHRHVRQGVRNFLPVAVFYALALMSKPMVVTLPFLLLLLDFWPLGRLNPQGPALASGVFAPARGWRPLVVEKLPLVLMAASAGTLAFMAEIASGSVQDPGTYTVFVRVNNALAALVSYLGKTVWPARLAVFYPHLRDTLSPWAGAAAGVVLAVCTVGALRLKRRCPAVLTGWLWFLVALTPVIGLVQAGEQAMADRYTYIPLVGLFIAAAWGGGALLPMVSRGRVAAVGAGIVVALYAAAAHRQTGYWRNSTTLFEHCLAVTRDNPLAQYSLGEDHSRRREHHEAAEHYRSAVQIEPEYGEAHLGLGRAMALTGRPDAALHHFREAVRLRPRSLEAQYGLGNALYQSGDAEGAIAHYREALRIHPGFSWGHNNIGIVFAGQGREEEALHHFREAVRADRENESARGNLQRLRLLSLGQEVDPEL